MYIKTVNQDRIPRNGQSFWSILKVGPRYYDAYPKASTKFYICKIFERQVGTSAEKLVLRFFFDRACVVLFLSNPTFIDPVELGSKI